MPPWEKYQEGQQSTGKPWEKYGAAPARQPLTADQFLAGYDQETGAPPPQQEAPQQGNRISRAIGDFADQKLFPGPAGSIVQGGARIAQQIAADPLKELVIEPAKQPLYAAAGINDASKELGKGNYREAAMRANEGALAAGNTAMMFIPGAGGAASRVAQQPARSAGRDFVANAERVGVTPTPAAMYPNSAGRVAKPLSENVIGGFAVRNEAKKVAGEIKDAVENTASLYSDAGYEQAGRGAIQGVKSQLKSRSRSNSQYMTFTEKADVIYRDAFSGIDQSKTYRPAQTEQTVADVFSRFDDAALQGVYNSKTPLTSKIRDVLDGRELSINDLRELRSFVRKNGNKNKLLRDFDDEQLARLEGALTEDISSAIEQNAGRKAVLKIKRADRFYRQNVTAIKTALKPFFREGFTEEQAFSQILSAAKPGAKGNIRQLRALRRSLTPQQMDDVSGALVRYMGRPQGKEGFSIETWANNWAGLGKAEKQVLFSRNQRPELMEQLDALADVVTRNADVERLANRSQSGASLGNIATIGAAGANLSNPVAVIGAAVGANAMGRLMMSPSFVKMLVKMERRNGSRPLDLSIARDKAYVVSAIAAAENSDAAIKPYMRDLREAIEASNDNLAEKPRRTGN